MTFQERKTARIDRMRARAERLQAQSDAAYKTSTDMISFIPMGQPILVGHYSEKRDRNYRDRAWNKLGQSVKLGREAESLKERANAAENNDSISSDDPQAIQLLEQKLAELEAKRAHWKQCNALYLVYLRTPEKLEQADATDEVKAIVRNNYRQVQPYKFNNLSARIRSVKQRIAYLQRQAARPAAEPLTIGHVQVIEDREENRVRIIFPDKPSDEVRATLKSNGFRWSPRAGAWQRQANAHSLYIAQQIAQNIADTQQPQETPAPLEYSEDTKYFLDLKAKHPETLILVRVGDYFECYDGDARTVASIFHLPLADRVSATGTVHQFTSFRYFELDTILPQLVRAGRRVAVVEDQKKVSNKPESREASALSIGRFS